MKPLNKIFDNNTVFPFPLKTHSYKFDEFQKSEMIQEELFEGDIYCKTIAIERNGVLIILKQEVKQIINKSQSCG